MGKRCWLRLWSFHHLFKQYQWFCISQATGNASDTSNVVGISFVV